MAYDICSRWGNATVAPSGRTMHLVDADNLLGDPNTVDGEFIASVLAQYRSVSGYQPGDLVVMATGRNGMHVFEVEAAWPGVSHRRKSGVDGADLELLEAAEWAATCGRFDRVVIGSGDRIFMLAVNALRAVDIVVDVVARRASVAACLALQVRGHVFALDGSGEIRPTVARSRRTSLTGRPSSRPVPAPMTNEMWTNAGVELMASA